MTALGAILSTTPVAAPTGTPDGTKFLRDDEVWAAAPGAGGGDSITVNGVAVVDADFDSATPAAPAGSLNVTWQKDAGSPANVSAYIKEAWPVGAVFTAVVSTNPNTLLGYGTWAALAAGRVLIGLDSGDTDFDTVEETGGAKTVASSAQTFAGSALATHQHAAITAGTPAGTNAAEAAHTHTYGTIAHTHGLSTILRTATTGGDTTHVAQAVDASSTADTTRLTDSTGAATSPTGAGSSHNHVFTGSALGTHIHNAITAGTPAGTNTPGAATSVVQPYLVVYMWKRTA
jgi:hypothetical protein